MQTIREMLVRINRRELEAAAALEAAIVAGQYDLCDEPSLERAWKLIASGDKIPAPCAAAAMRVLMRFAADKTPSQLVEAWPTLSEGSKANVACCVATPDLLPTPLVRRLFEASDSSAIRHIILAGMVKTYARRQCRDDLEFMAATVGTRENAAHQANLDRVVAAARAELRGKPAEAAPRDKPWWKVW